MSKAAANRKWTSSQKYRDNYDRIFGKEYPIVFKDYYRCIFCHKHPYICRCGPMEKDALREMAKAVDEELNKAFTT